MPQVHFQLYLITDRSQAGDRSLSDVIRQAARGGISAVQFREKDLPLRVRFQLASEVQAITKQYGMKFLINDRIDLCLALDADGVHLPSSGLPVGVARKILGMDKWIGVSCHSLEEVQRGENEGADFGLLGPIYDTPSKRPYGPPLGPERFREIKKATSIPLFAVGGIDLCRLEEIFSAGADGIAVISAIGSSDDVLKRSRLFLEEIKRLRSV
ncbi:MAG: thiamine phosphate synthase [Nitrospiria bacterium]